MYTFFEDNSMELYSIKVTIKNKEDRLILEILLAMADFKYYCSETSEQCAVSYY